MLHPEYSVVEGKYQITTEWSVMLDQPYNKRIEDGSLVIWRPGLTVWINVWNNDKNESIEDRLQWLSSNPTDGTFQINSENHGKSHTYSYRLNEKSNGHVTLSHNGYVISQNSHVQLSVYFDSESDFKVAESIINSVSSFQP